MVGSAHLGEEVWTGAGASATFIPETSVYLGNGCVLSTDGKTLTLDGTADDYVRLIVDLYVGCEVSVLKTTRADVSVKSNTSDTIVFSEDVTALVTGTAATGSATTTGVTAHIKPYGAPCPAFDDTLTGTEHLLSDNWLGLVTSFNPPSLEVEVAQMNLALGGTRNYTYQYKKGSTVTGASFDVDLNHGAWLYYALGKITSLEASADTAIGTDVTYNDFARLAHDDENIFRVVNGKTYPSPAATGANGILSGAEVAYTALDEMGTAPLIYQFEEKNSGILPSFALEITYQKDETEGTFVGDDGTSGTRASAPFRDIFTRIVTGCQVNSLTLNFDEGTPLTCSLDLVSRRLFDAPSGYAPRRGQTHELSKLANFNSNEIMNRPYMFSDGEISLYGQTYGKIKSGSLAINNNLTAQRYIGNYKKDMISGHIGGQRTYDLNFTMQVTDTQLWEYLKQDGEHLGTASRITLKFAKTSVTEGNENDYIEIQLEDFLTQSLDFPFPDDKGPVEVALTLSARKLQSCTYKGTWHIINQEH